MKDRTVQASYPFAPGPVSETAGGNRPYGFRRERGTGDAAGQCFTAPSRKGTLPDGCGIKGCPDRIGHEWAANNIPSDRMILRKWLQSGFMLKKRLYPTEEGTP